MLKPEYPNLKLLHLDTQTHLSINTECEYPQCSTSKDLQIFIYLIDSTKYITFSFFLKIGKHKVSYNMCSTSKYLSKPSCISWITIRKTYDFKYSWFFENYRPVNAKQRSHDVIV